MKTNNPKICIVGSISFHTGIGKHTYALCEMLSRFAKVCLIPIEKYSKDKIELPSGRLIPICRNPDVIEITFYCAVLWNYTGDCNVYKMPSNGLHFAMIAFDSDRVPKVWVDILNTRFDGVYLVNKNLETFAKASGINIPIGTLPLALDIANFLTHPLNINKTKSLTIGAVSSFHPRKQNDLLIKAFGNLQSRYKNIKLKIHSNLNFASNLELCENIRNQQPIPENIELTCKNFTNEELFNFMKEIDIFVNCSRGEGFSIGPREAAALGKPVVLSGVFPHLDFKDVPGAFIAEANIPIPSEYPELEGIVAGNQFSISEKSLENEIANAIEYVFNDNTIYDALLRKEFASQWNFPSTIPWYLALINPDASEFRFPGKASSGIGNISKQFQEKVRSQLGKFSNKLDTPKKVVLQVHDGGFFSIFNAYMSHLVWSENDNDISAVLPDWDVSRFLKRMTDKKVMSFCYGQPQDGNVFLKFFKPLPGITADELQSEEFLLSNSKIITESDEYFNVQREPLLTYINAATLYKSKDFINFRQRYNRILKKYIHLRPEIESEVNDFCKVFNGKFVIGAHVRHPSHAIEQADHKMPTPMDYVNEIKNIISKRNISNWLIFLATDQDRTIDIFKREFGNKVVFYKTVRRLTDQEDKDFDALPDNSKAVEGFQLQHKVAKDHKNWSTEMAREVIIDAWTMSKCNILLHVTSNVSTAVSYIGPETEFISMIAKD